eukprot:m.192263 g.192263  ORF g.192263 m.192263 type:complete len:72 (-) comp14851_c2_seq3:401-616(-)
MNTTAKIFGLVYLVLVSPNFKHLLNSGVTDRMVQQTHQDQERMTAICVINCMHCVCEHNVLERNTSAVFVR